MREKTTTSVEQADEIVSIIKPLDVEALSLDDRLTILGAWMYIVNNAYSDNVPLIVETHKSLSSVLAHCIQSLVRSGDEGWEYLRKAESRFNDMDELLTALSALRETVETT